MPKWPVSGIERTPGVCGGDPCVRRTRIPVWLLVRAQQLGSSDAEILEDYPTLSHHDLDNAWHCYKQHRARPANRRQRGHGVATRHTAYSKSSIRLG